MDDLNDKGLGGNLSHTEWNQVPSELQNVIENMGISLAPGDLFQLGKAIAGMAGASDFYTAGGTADALTAAKIGAKQAPVALDAVHDGLRVRLRPGAVNTGAATLDFLGYGAVDIKRENGDALVAGDLDVIRDAVMRWDNATGDFFLLNSSLPVFGEVPRGYIDGLITDPDSAADPLNDLVIGTGICRSTGVSLVPIELTSALSKSIDGNWTAGGVPGTPLGGFPSGLSLTADTWYHVFSIRHTNGTVDGGFDTSTTAANLRSDAGASYTGYRRVGSILTNGSSQIIAFIQRGDTFLWYDPIIDVSAASGYNASAGPLETLSVPPDYVSEVLMTVSVDNMSSPVYIFADGVHNENPGLTTAPLANYSEPSDLPHKNGTVLSNTSSQVRVRCADTDIQIYVQTDGWVDARGRDL